MLTHLVRRLLLAVPTLFGITLIVFLIITLAPGDPAANRVGDMPDPAMSARMQEEIRERYHLDKPVITRYFLWLGDLVTGDLGSSITDDTPVSGKISRSIWPTVKVNLLALSMAFFLSLPIGIYAAARQNGWFDRISGVILYMLYSLPSFVGAILLILVIVRSKNWGAMSFLNAIPWRGEFSDDHGQMTNMGQFVDMVSHMTLYTVCVVYGSLAYYSRFVRQNMLEVVRQDYIRTARAKGLSERTVILKHAFRNTMIPFITLLGLIIPFLLGGSVILEKIFTWPGMGKLFIDSVFQRDYAVIMALSTATAILVLLSNLTVDLMYGVVDPRVSHR